MARAKTTVVVKVTIPADIRKALRKVEEATGSLASVAALPSRIGAQIRWVSNGLIWTRVGEDEWQPAEPELDLFTARDEGWTSPSAHIASGAFEIVEETA